MAPEYCPHCGTEVPEGARACPECGSDEQTGWSDRAHADRLGLPDETFDYEEFTRDQFEQRPLQRRGPPLWVWGIVAAGVLVVWVVASLRF